MARPRTPSSPGRCPASGFVFLAVRIRGPRRSMLSSSPILAWRSVSRTALGHPGGEMHAVQGGPLPVDRDLVGGIAVVVGIAPFEGSAAVAGQGRVCPVSPDGNRPRVRV